MYRSTSNNVEGGHVYPIRLDVAYCFRQGTYLKYDISITYLLLQCCIILSFSFNLHTFRGKSEKFALESPYQLLSYENHEYS